MNADKKHESTAQADTALFRSVSQEEFDRLPRPSAEDIRRALDAGRPAESAPGAPALRLDPAMRFF